VADSDIYTVELFKSCCLSCIIIYIHMLVNLIFLGWCVEFLMCITEKTLVVCEVIWAYIAWKKQRFMDKLISH